MSQFWWDDASADALALEAARSEMKTKGRGGYENLASIAPGAGHWSEAPGAEPGKRVHLTRFLGCSRRETWPRKQEERARWE